MEARKERGNKGEGIAADFLKKSGYKVLARNYTNKVGEIDIIAQKNKAVVFVEVKSQEIEGAMKDSEERLYPERNVDKRKQKTLIKTAEYYLLENDYPEDTIWQIDVIGVDLNMATRLANLRHLKNAISE
jgi:putative endonuclease